MVKSTPRMTKNPESNGWQWVESIFVLSLFDIDFIQSSEPVNDVLIHSWGPFYGQIMNIKIYCDTNLRI